MGLIERSVLTYLANAVWMTCLIVTATALLARLIRQSPDAHRHVLWVTALVFAALIPLTSLRAPSATSHDRSATFANDNGVSELSTNAGEGSATNSFWFKMGQRSRSIAFAPLLTQILTAVYLGFVAYRALALCWAWHRTRGVLHRARPYSLPDHQAAIVEHCFVTLRTGRVCIVRSADLCGPVVIGAWRPLLVFPEWFFSCLSADEFASALSHELAHVLRHDFLHNLIHEIFLLPISFHPAAWLIKAQIEESREIACDEIAAGRLPTRAVYARSLLSIARFMSVTPYSAGSSCAMEMFDADTLEKRIVNLLKKPNHSAKTWSRVQTLVAGCFLLTASLLASSFSIRFARASTSPTEVERFTGTWEGKFKGQTFVTLKLAAKDGKISGTVSRVSILMSPGGELTEAAPVTGQDAIAETAPNGKAMYLTTNAKARVKTFTGEFEQSIRYGLTLTGKDHAEMQISGGPLGMTVPAAWKLERNPTNP